MGGPPRGGGRRRRGDVRAALLLLLTDEPRNGYQLMQAIEERTAGRWRPSPGSVYPTLAQLEDEGLIRSIEQDGQRVFELTDAGRQQATEREGAGAPFASGGAPGEEARHEVRALVGQVAMAARQVVHAADERQLERARDLLAQTRRALYGILADEPGAGPDQAGGEPGAGLDVTGAGSDVTGAGPDVTGAGPEVTGEPGEDEVSDH